MLDREMAISWMQDARDIHARYAAFLQGEECPLDQEHPQADVGDAGWHELWVDRYDVVLSLLRADD